jgi:hypothetical protein
MCKNNFITSSVTNFRRVRIVAEDTITFVNILPSIRLSVCVFTRISVASTGRISVKFDIEDFYENLSRNSKFS